MARVSSLDIGFVAIAVLVSAVLFGIGVLGNRFYRDRIFQKLTPGLVPARGQMAIIGRVGPGREYSGEVAVAFNPPKGLRPGLVGTIVDGVAEMRDITATIVDLGARGHVRIRAVDDGRTGKPHDWEITLREEAPPEHLSAFERRLLESLFTPKLLRQTPVRLRHWAEARKDDLRRLRDDLYRQTVEYGWYERDPRHAGGGCWHVLGFAALLLWCVVMLVLSFGAATVLSAALMLGAAVFASTHLRRREPRTALGTAVTIQALGFKKYLATAEGRQFKVEEAAGVFSRYLPYALVFGVAAHWSKVFGEIVEHNPELVLDGLAWFDLGTDVLIGVDLLMDLGDLGADFIDLGDALEGIGGFVEGVGDFISSLDV